LDISGCCPHGSVNFISAAISEDRTQQSHPHDSTVLHQSIDSATCNAPGSPQEVAFMTELEVPFSPSALHLQVVYEQKGEMMSFEGTSKAQKLFSITQSSQSSHTGHNTSMLLTCRRVRKTISLNVPVRTLLIPHLVGLLCDTLQCYHNRLL
jgi:hypothetical protein